MDLVSVAEELYALSPAHFTEARNARAKEVKGEGDAALAKQIKALVKPSTAAWVVNMLVRHHAEQVAQVLSLGAALRQAQQNLAGEELRQLSRQRRQLTAAVTGQARGLALDLGQRIGDPVAAQVEETLTAAMTDQSAADAVRTGMLTRPLSATGVGMVDLEGAVAVPKAIGRSATPVEHPPPALTVVQDDGRALDEAKRAVAEAEAGASGAEKLLAKAERRVAKLEARSLQIQGELEELRRRVGELEHQLERTDEELTTAEEERDEAAAAHADAVREIERAKAKLQKLER